MLRSSNAPMLRCADTRHSAHLWHEDRSGPGALVKLGSSLLTHTRRRKLPTRERGEGPARSTTKAASESRNVGTCEDETSLSTCMSRCASCSRQSCTLPPCSVPPGSWLSLCLGARTSAPSRKPRPGFHHRLASPPVHRELQRRHDRERHWLESRLSGSKSLVWTRGAALACHSSPDHPELGLAAAAPAGLLGLRHKPSPVPRAALVLSLSSSARPSSRLSSLLHRFQASLTLALSTPPQPTLSHTASPPNF